jgi:hypothetical protein
MWLLKEEWALTIVLICEVCNEPFCYSTVFFLEHAGVLRINILRIKCYSTVYHKLFFLLFSRLSAKVGISTERSKNVTGFVLFYEIDIFCIGRLTSPFGHQGVPAAVNSHVELACKISPPTNYSTRKQIQNLECQSGDVFSLLPIISLVPTD